MLNSKTRKLAVIGSGSFGAALAKVCVNKGHEVTLWGRDQKVIDAINQTQTHPKRLKGVSLPKELKATTSFGEATHNADLVILALPMSAMGTVLSENRSCIAQDTLLVSTAKGIEEDTCLLSDKIIERALPHLPASSLVYLSGPSFAIDLAMGRPAAVTLASKSLESARAVQEALSGSVLRGYVSNDVQGVLLGGALKNVIAIAAGGVEGLELGKSALSALITRGIAEIKRLSLKMGAERDTLSGLSGLGDLVLTCTTPLSRNYSVGYQMAQGKTLEEALAQIGQVAEGVQTAKSINTLAQKYQVEMPISQGVYGVLYQGKPPRDLPSMLMLRDLKPEWD